MADGVALDKMYGPLPLWGWGLVLSGSYYLYRKLWHASPKTNSAPTAFNTGVTGAPITVDATPYTPPSVFPVGVSNPSPTPGSQGGSWSPGITPAVTPILPSGSTLLDPTTGHPIYSGPNGEGGFAYKVGDPIPMGQMVYQMPDGRYSSYYPGQYVQNGNRVALGLAPLPTASSIAPGANPAAVSSLLGTSGGMLHAV